jgi:hypothetical protein
MNFSNTPEQGMMEISRLGNVKGRTPDAGG